MQLLKFISTAFGFQGRYNNHPIITKMLRLKGREVHRIPILSVLLFFISMFFTTEFCYSQTSVDASIGSSFQDDFNAQFTLRKEFSSRLRAGFEFQYGSPKYRFVSTKVMTEGYSYSFSLPVSYLITAKESIQLFGIGRVGARFQGIIDPDNNDMRDSVLASTALISEFGLISSFGISEKVNLQSGISFPIAYELSPNSLTEYTWVKLHFGGSWAVKQNTFFLHANIGNAFGASGDTYKYIWSTELGIRRSFGESKNDESKLIQPSF